VELFFRIAAVVVAAYLLGAIPFTLVVGKLFFNLDPREHGSGNLGATNALRVLGRKAALGVAALDISKGMAAVILAKVIVPLPPAGIDLGWAGPAQPWAMVAALLAAVIGHGFSPYIGFKGGKGVAVAAGAITIMTPATAGILLVVFVAVVYFFRYASLASITVAGMFPVLVLLLNREVPYIFVSFLAAALVLWLHRTNIARLRAGTESKVSFGSRTKPEEGEQP